MTRDALASIAALHVRQLPSGYWHIRGFGPLNWAQPPRWPCDEATLREHAFPQASEAFIRVTLRAALAKETTDA